MVAVRNGKNVKKYGVQFEARLEASGARRVLNRITFGMVLCLYKSSRTCMVGINKFDFMYEYDR